MVLYMDHHVHAAITDGLRRRGVEVITAQEDGAARFDDERLLERATQLGCILFSQDKDLLILT
jgi:predicted nuclease of predicted toxin-antitoxin system